MPWGPEDWEDLQRPETSATPCEASWVRAVRDVLLAIPRAHRRSVAVIGRTGGAIAPLAETSFDHVVRLDAPSGDACTWGRAWPKDTSFDLVLGASPIVLSHRVGIDRVFRTLHGALAEGGLLLTGFVARCRRDAPIEMPLGTREPGGDGQPLHEVELQYRLRRAGFQGVRIRRFRGEMGLPEIVLCMAVRRASN